MYMNTFAAARLCKMKSEDSNIEKPLDPYTTGLVDDVCVKALLTS